MKRVILDDDYRKFIDYSIAYQTMNVSNPIQVEIIDENFNEEFIKFGHKICEYERIEELSGFQRKSSTLKFEEVIHKASTSSKCGMKINHFPQYKMLPWEQWGNGYIEFFIRMDGITGGNEIFIWQDIPMRYLTKIIKKFAYKLEYWEI